MAKKSVAVGGEDEDGSGAEEAVLFGWYNSVGWYLGCSLGAVLGNALFLVSATAMFLACCCAAVATLLLLVVYRRRVFAERQVLESDLGADGDATDEALPAVDGDTDMALQSVAADGVRARREVDARRER